MRDSFGVNLMRAVNILNCPQQIYKKARKIYILILRHLVIWWLDTRLQFL